MSIDRRRFLKGLSLGGAVAGVSAAGTATAGGGAERFPGYEGRMGLLHDTTLCIGCRACEQACNEVNHLDPVDPPIGTEGVFDEQRLLNDQLLTVVNRYRPAQGNSPAIYRKHQCMHCNEPCCASVCFVEAFTKTPEGPVLYDPEVCVGCRYCVFACPYYALTYEYGDALTPRVMRCTMCYPRIIQGQQPACAEACPAGAIVYGEREELIRVARERIRKFPGRYLPDIFGEHEFAGTSWLTLSGVPFREVGFFAEPSHITRTPLPEFTTSFLSLAPLVAAIFPGMLAGFYAFSRRKEIIAHQQLNNAVQHERVRSAEELEARLRQAAEEAAREKNYAVERAVRDALRRGEEARAKAAEAQAAGAAEEAPKKKKKKEAGDGPEGKGSEEAPK